MGTAMQRAREAIDRAIEMLESAVKARNGIVFSGTGVAAGKAIALTFDDGPSASNTPQVLDLLREFGARATFFVVGQEIPGREDIVARIASEGHELANHTYSHPHTIALNKRQLREELERTNDVLAKIEGVAPIRAVRPPYGKDRRRTDAIGRELGMRTVLWSVDSGDTGAERHSPDAVARNVIMKAEPGSIVLLHDGGDARPATVAACETLLSALAGRGFEFVTVSSLLAHLDPAPPNQAFAR